MTDLLGVNCPFKCEEYVMAHGWGKTVINISKRLGDRTLEAVCL